MQPIKMVAVDMDGTFLRSGRVYDKPRFRKILRRMQAQGARFVVASGNQYAQLHDTFAPVGDEIAYVAENGALVAQGSDILFAAAIPRDTVTFVLDWCDRHPEVLNIFCGLRSAYCQRGRVEQKFFDIAAIYYHKLEWADDLHMVDDQILKFALDVPADQTARYVQMLREELDGRLVPTSSGHGSIDLILPGCHKASGLQRLAALWGLTPEECAAFGDGGNDVEMLRWCRHSYAMDNAPDDVKRAAAHVCPSNEEDGVLQTLDVLFPE